MSTPTWLVVVAAALLSVVGVACSDSSDAPPANPGADGWTADFPVAREDFVSVGRNSYFILEPGYRLRLEGDGVELVITVLNETKLVDGVETRVVEERESEDGELTEVARNYFAIDRRTNNVYYFGEDVDFYKDGKVTGHEGTWYSGVDGAKYGLVMPAQITIGAQYYQEIAPKVALDRAKNISVTETVKTPAGEFKDCLKVEETNPLEKNAREFKYYAPGIGLIQDADLKLVAYGKQ
jgi:hypothetical protein